jgi:zinc finger protein
MFRDIGVSADAASARTADHGHGHGDSGCDCGGEHGEEINTDIHTSDDGVMSLSSLCMSCEEQGTTNLLLTRIPFFRNIIIMAFSCPHCGYRNTEVQPAEVQEKGCKFELNVMTAEDLNRQVIKSDKAVVSIPSLDFEIPANTQRGVFSTVEGLLTTALDGLRQTAAALLVQDPSTAGELTAFLGKLEGAATGSALPFVLTLDDPTGNSFIENPSAPKLDPNMKVHHYVRSAEQNKALALSADNAGEGHDFEAGEDAGAGGGGSGDASAAEDKAGGLITTETDRARASAVRDADGKLEGLIFDSSASDMKKEVMKFPVDCYACGKGGETNMCVTDIPHFKEVIIMAFLCDHCGYKSVEIKGGGAVPDHGQVLTLSVEPGEGFEETMRRDLIKSDTAAIIIPEIDLEVEHGSLGGLYTTVEGLLVAVKDKLVAGNPFAAASVDSADTARREAFFGFISKLDAVMSGEMAFTLKLEDPMANSWIYSPTAPEPDPRLDVSNYTRSRQQDLELGLLDMKTEHYGEQAAIMPVAEGDEEADEDEDDADETAR